MSLRKNKFFSGTAALTKVKDRPDRSHLNLQRNETSLKESQKNLPAISPKILDCQKGHKQLKTNADPVCTNSSTLSLHIAAYENAIESCNSYGKNVSNRASFKESHENRFSWPTTKELYSSLKSKNSIEIPRQQEREEATDPEVMQFKASQRLYNPHNPSQKEKDKNPASSSKKVNPAVDHISPAEGSDSDEDDCVALDFSHILSDNEDSENAQDVLRRCIDTPCYSSERPPAAAETPDDERMFEFNANNDASTIIEKHAAYLCHLKESDGRLHPVEPLVLISHSCSCGQRCEAFLSLVDICQFRLLWPLHYKDRVAAQFFMIKSMMTAGVFRARLKNHYVCDKFFAAVNIFPLHRIHRFAALIKEGVIQPVHPNSGRHFERETTLTKISKLAIFVDENFDSDPASCSFMATQYSKCSAAGEALNIPFIDRRKQNFTKLFNKLSASVHFQSSNSKTKCKTCCETAIQLRKLTLDPEERKRMQKELDEHKQKMRDDRRDYNLRKTASLERPTQFLSLIHDGMAKTATKVPLLNDHRSKDVEDAERMPCGLHLALIHRKDGINNTASVGFFSPGGCYDGTTNSMVSQILYAISTCPIVPPTVLVQLDNFPGNKSYALFGAFAYVLLRQSAIREWYISFMMPGHTHCDVDARFGNFSTFLNKRECGSPRELMQAFTECIKGEAKMKQTLYNFNDALIPFCHNYGKVRSLYDFHLFIDEHGVPIVEEARFRLSESYLCGTRRDENSFVSKKIPPLDLNIRVAPPKLEGLEITPKILSKWEKVISEDARNEYLTLKNEIEFHPPTPLTTLLRKIEANAASPIPMTTLPVSPNPSNLEPTYLTSNQTKEAADKTTSPSFSSPKQTSSVPSVRKSTRITRSAEKTVTALNQELPKTSKSTRKRKQNQQK